MISEGYTMITNREECKCMKILALEDNALEQQEISKCLKGCNITYETSILKTINRVGIDIIDCVLVDADFENGIFNWQDLQVSSRKGK